VHFRQVYPLFGGQQLDSEFAWHAAAPLVEELRSHPHESAMRGRGLHGIPLAALRCTDSSALAVAVAASVGAADAVLMLAHKLVWLACYLCCDG